MSTTKATTSLIPPTYLPYLGYAAATIATIPTAIGIFSLAQPASTLEQLKFPPPKQDHALVYGLMRIIAARNIAIGLSVIGIWYHTCRNAGSSGGAGFKALGTAMLGLGIFTAVDGWVTKGLLGEGEWAHWGLVPVNVGIGVGLLGWV